MTTRSLFTKNYFLFAGLILLGTALFFVFSFLVRSVNTTKERQIPPHHKTFALLLKASQDPIETIRQYQKSAEGERSLKMDLVDKDGKSFVEGSEGLGRAFKPDEIKDLESGQPVAIVESMMGPPSAFVTEFEKGKYLIAKFGHRPGDMPPPPPPGVDRGGPPMGPPGGPGPRPPRGGMSPLIAGLLGGPPNFFFYTSLISFILCILISVGIALLIFMRNYGRQAKAAMTVLDEMKHGDLKARMSSGRFDELAPLTQAFNQMADEVESLVESLKRSDLARRTMLQDLAHDLRTPLASLRVFLETLATSGDKMTEEKKKEVLQISLSEIKYFSELVEDLLFMAQITEPKYSRETDNVDLGRVAADQCVLFKNQYQNLSVKSEVTTATIPVIVGSEQLITRLVKNAVSNACSFAENEVRVFISSPSQDKLQILVEDDGPGFSPSALAEFGHKKASRKISNLRTGSRISVGIGSVIMREIANLHAGSLEAENRTQDGQIRGARIKITLKRTST